MAHKALTTVYNLAPSYRPELISVAHLVLALLLLCTLGSLSWNAISPKILMACSLTGSGLCSNCLR